ncbi:MAG: PilC/PilY family type IV pilus protein, partial [Gammaproteobacteria bacterium]
LGDIVRSSPLIVGAPSASIGDQGYAEFYERMRQRRATVYVGANDGMLHAFDVATGRERFAYIPAALLPALPALTQPGYQHRAYVDGSP